MTDIRAVVLSLLNQDGFTPGPDPGIPETILFRMGYLIALVALGSMIYLSFRTDVEYHDSVFFLIGFISLFLFLFGVGGEHFDWPIPGLIWGLSAVAIAFVFGIMIGWLLPFTPEVAIRRKV